MKYYHLTTLGFAADEAALTAAFKAIEPDNNLSVNRNLSNLPGWPAVSTECVVKAPGGVSLTVPPIAIYDSPPIALVTSDAWLGGA